MDIQEYVQTRRRALHAMLHLGTIALAAPILAVAKEPPRMTPPLALGPFYPQIKPRDQDADLTVMRHAREDAQGQVVQLSGRVVDLDGKPVAGARVAIWQADARGHYHHPSDRQGGEADPHFQGFGMQTTDAQGRYRFKTIKPGPYPGLIAGIRAPHIHFEVHGRYDRVVTQMFFPDEPLNAQDRLLQDVRSDYRDLVIARRLPANAEPEALSLAWDVVMLSG